jgi:hypothetical protein
LENVKLNIFLYVVLEKNGKDQLDRSIKKEVLHRGNEERNILQELRRNCLLKHVTEGKIESKRRRGRRPEKLWMTFRKRDDTGN